MSQPTRIGGAVKLFGDGLKEICHDSSGFGYGEVAAESNAEFADQLQG